MFPLTVCMFLSERPDYGLMIWLGTKLLFLLLECWVVVQGVTQDTPFIQKKPYHEPREFLQSEGLARSFFHRTRGLSDFASEELGSIQLLFLVGKSGCSVGRSEVFKPVPDSASFLGIQWVCIKIGRSPKYPLVEGT